MLRTMGLAIAACVIAVGVGMKIHTVHGQVSSQAMPVSVAITIYRPVQTASGVSVVPQTGNNPAYGIAAMSGAVGSLANVVKYGDYPCEFDAAPTLGDTAVPLNGYCHDSGVLSDISILNTVGVIGKIMKLRPDLGANFAEVTIGFPGRRGTMVDAASLDPATVPAYVQNQFVTAMQSSSSTTTFANAAPVQSVAGRMGAVVLTSNDVSGLAPVATSGSYADLTNKPTLTTGPQGNPGAAATVAVGTTTTGTAAVTNSGTSSAAIFNFTVPQGVAGQNGTNAANPAFTASSTGLAAGASPTVTLTGTYPAQNLAFGIPAGAAGANGQNGTAGQNGTNANNPSFTASASNLTVGSAATATLSGTYPALNLAFGIPAGVAGANGTNGTNGASGIGPFSAPSASWPSWLVPTVTNPSTTPSLTVAASAIPNAALANSTITMWGVTCTLGSTCAPVEYLKGTTGTITGTLLALGGQDSGTATVTGATSGMPCIASTTDGSNPSSSVVVSCIVTAANTATVYLTAIVAGTPGSKSYNVRVFP